MNTDNPEAPRIEFPCAGYPVKIIGHAGPDFADLVVEVVERHAPGLDRSSVRVRDSRNGRYLSVQIEIVATSEEQLRAINHDLRATGRVHMVL